MSVWFGLYVLCGPLFWLGLCALAWTAATRMDRLHADRSPLPEPPPTLCIVVPAKDEAAGIRDCVGRIRAQDYPDAHIVVIDDRSSDGTGATLDALAAADPCVRPYHVTDLPPGWLGKCHALFVGTRGLTSDWLLFVDSDVGLAPDAARRAVALCERRAYDALSIMPALVAPTFWERALLPILAVAWGAAFQISRTNDDTLRGHAFANGQFFLIRRAWYERVRGHESVRDQIVEDVALMRVLKAQGARTRLMMGGQLARTRMHTNLRQMFHGWARIFAGSSGRSATPILATIGVMLVTLILLFAGPIAAMAIGGRWTVASTAHATLVLGFLAWAYTSAGQNVLHALLVPLTWPMTITILCYAVRVCRTGRVVWRGNTVDVNARSRAPTSTGAAAARRVG